MTAAVPLTAPDHEQVLVRPWKLATDGEGIILKPWLRSYRASAFGKQMTDKRFYDGWMPVVTRIMARSEILLCVPEDSPATVYGWLCHEPKAATLAGTTEHAIHFAYTKGGDEKDGTPNHRRTGILTTLMQAADVHGDVTATHWTADANDIKRDWTDDNALIRGRCRKCHVPLDARETEGGMEYRCPAPRKPPCPAIWRPKGYVLAPKPNITIDLTLV